VRVTTSEGTWHVRRRWAPRRLGAQTVWARFLDRTRRARRRTTELGDVADPGCLPDITDGIVAFLVVLALILFFVFIGLPLLIALGELVLILVLALIGVIGRVLFRRPWTIDAVSPSGVLTQWSVVGWRASAAARRFVAQRIATGTSLPAADEVIGATRRA
jgi:hypothetical protein